MIKTIFAIAVGSINALSVRVFQLRSDLFSFQRARRTTFLLSLLCIAACQPFSNKGDQSVEQGRASPEPASIADALTTQKQATGAQFVAVTANPLATDAATRMLRAGGNAIDAAIAAQMVLGLVEPQSSGVGGGGFLTYWDASQQKVTTYDGREIAPENADASLFVGASGQPVSWFDAVIGGRSVGVPGLIHMLYTAHQANGALPWSVLFDDAIQIAEKGFAVSPRLHALISYVPKLNVRKELKSYLFEDDKPLAVGQRLTNSAYADVLRRVAAEGPGGFYQGQVAQDIVDAVGNDNNAGGLSLDDMKAYRSIEREPVCYAVLEHKLCGMGPPSSGGVTIASILATMEVLLDQGLLDYGVPINENADVAHAFIEVTRLAFADRNTYLADSDFVDVPIDALLNRDYLHERAALIDLNKRTEQISAGKFEPMIGERIESTSPELTSTTHLSIVDSEGNALSMTTSIETAFGSRIFVDGFILNNQLTDFSFVPEGLDGELIANRVQSRKRPRSSMSPLILFDGNEKPALVIGSPGGSSIIAYVARAIYDHIVGDLNLEEAVRAQHIVGGDTVRVEKNLSAALVQELERKGHTIQRRDQTSGLHVIKRTASGWQGVADFRREGSVAAQ